MSNLREQKKRKTRKAILAAAIRLFDKKGFEKTSIEEMAREAGVGKGTIYTYFQTKTEIFYAFCEEQLEFVHAELASKTDPDGPFIDQIMTIFLGEFRHVTQNKEFGRFFMQQVLFPQEKEMGHFKAVDNRWLDMLFSISQKAQDRRELRKDIDHLYLAGHFYGLYVIVISAWYTGRITTEEVEPGMRMLFQQALEGLSPKTSSSSNSQGELHG